MQISLRSRAIASLTALLALSSLGGYIAIQQFATINDAARGEIQRNITVQTLAHRALLAACDGHTAAASAFVIDQAQDLDRIEEKLSTLQGTVSDFDLLMKALQFGTTSAAFHSASGGLTAQQWQRRGWADQIVLDISPPNISSAVPAIELTYDRFARQAQKSVKLLRRSFYYALQSDPQQSSQSHMQAAQLIAGLDPIGATLEQQLEDLVNNAEENTARAVEQAHLEQRTLIQHIALFTLLAGALLLSLLWVKWSRLVISPVQQLLSKLKLVGLGDLQQEFKTSRGDEIGLLSNALADMLSELSVRTVSRDFVDNIIQSMADTLVVVRSDNTILRVNQATLELLGYGEAALLGQPMSKIVVGSHPQHYLNEQEQQLLQAQGFIADLEKTYRTESGRHIPVLFSASIMRNKQGQEEGIVCVAQDISERKRVQQSMQEMRVALEIACIGTSRLSAAGQYLEVDKNYAATLGYEPHELLGSGWQRTVFADDIPIVMKAYQELLNNGRSEFDARAIRKDGSIFYKHVVMALSRDESGKYDGHYCFMSDVDQTKQAYFEMQRAKDAALQAAKMKSEFLANMSHEIRTPMNGVIGMTELLLDTELTAEQQDLAETVRVSADSLLTIINDVLDFSKLEAGKFTLNHTVFHGHDWFGRILHMMQIQSNKKGQELIGVYSPHIPSRLIGDFNRVQQILINLIGNAIKFTPEYGGILLMAEMESRSSEQVVVHFSVSDSGVGIPSDKVDQIFDPFVQADGSTTRKYGGTGLGLSISRELVTLMGGKIWAESTLGVGSTFHVSIPFQWITHDQEGDKSLQAIERSLEQLADLKVALLDCNPANAKNIARLLAGWGMQPTVFTEWSEGITQLRATRHEYHLIIVNVSGQEPAAQQAQRRELADIVDGCPFLFLLPRHGEIAITDLAQNGNVQFLTKPATNSGLLESIVKSIMKVSGREVVQQTAQNAPSRIVPKRNARVLLADDNAVNQKLACKLLEKAGYHVTIVNNGLAAIEAIKRDNFEVILMDIQMPELGGDEAMRIIRASAEPYAKVPIVALTAHAMEGDRERYLAMGANDYVSKPLKRDELYAAIERALEGSAST